MEKKVKKERNTCYKQSIYQSSVSHQALDANGPLKKKKKNKRLPM
jgi:hypothetical protein